MTANGKTATESLVLAGWSKKRAKELVRWALGIFADCNCDDPTPEQIITHILTHKMLNDNKE